MAIEFRCSQCNQLLRVPDDSVGRSARCPKCQSLMQVPAARAAQSSSAPSGTAPTTLFPSQLQPAPPAKPASDSPFGGPSAASPPNPFGDVGVGAKLENPFAAGASASLNPYATPAFTGYGVGAPFGERSGLPWEVQGLRFRTWWETMSLVLGQPSLAFSMMHQSGGLGNPILFNFWGFGAPLAALALLAIPFVLLFAIAGANNGEPAAAAGIAVGVIFGVFMFVAMYILLVVTIGALISSAVIHVCLLMVGGATPGYEPPFRVVSIRQGALAPVGVLLGCVPYLGALIHMVWIIVLTIIGIAKAHEIPGGKAALAVLLPAGVCFGLTVGLIIFSVVMDANR